MKNFKVTDFLKNNIYIILIMSLSAFLNVFGIWSLGYANLYYSSAVYSMGQNLHAFLYNSIDTIGFISIDKPPLGFWIQVLFTKIFGFSGVTVLIPQAIAGVISVFLIYRIIIKRFGKLPAIISALTLAVTPIFVAVCRNNTIDSLLIVTLLIATEFAIRAAESSRPKYLLLSALFIGIGFNIKMLQAYIIVPAVYITYLILSKQKIVKKILTCLLAFAVMATVSLSWVTFVDLTPEASRPYVGSSSSNSEIDLALGYNGLKRIIGGVFGGNKGSGNAPQQGTQMTTPGGGSDQQGTQMTPPGGSNQNGTQPTPPDNSNSNTSQTKSKQNDSKSRSFNKDNNSASGKQDFAGAQDGGFSQSKPTGQVGGGGNEPGATSPVRLFNTNNAGQIGWFVAPSLIFAVLGIVLAIIKRKELRKKNPAIIFFVSAFIPMFIYYSFASGLAHRYYFASFAPFIAGLVGVGVYLLSRKNRFSQIASVIVFALTAAVQLFIQYEYHWLPVLFYIMLGVFAAALALIIFLTIKEKGRKVIAAVLLTLFVLPTVWSFTPIVYGDVTRIPVAGPELMSKGNGMFSNGDYTKLITYLEKNRNGASYLVATPSALDAGSSIILQSGQAVMCLGGFNGQDTSLTSEEFAALCKKGTVRYALVSERSNSDITQWVEKNGTAISSSECGLGNSNYKLYKVG